MLKYYDICKFYKQIYISYLYKIYTFVSQLFNNNFKILVLCILLYALRILLDPIFQGG